MGTKHASCNFTKKPTANATYIFSLCREQKGQVTKGDLLDKSVLLHEFRLAMLCYWLAFERSVLFQTAGTARKTVCSKETQIGLMKRDREILLLSTQRQRKCVSSVLNRILK